jgi:hypothetical protein
VSPQPRPHRSLKDNPNVDVLLALGSPADARGFPKPRMLNTLRKTLSAYKANPSGIKRVIATGGAVANQFPEASVMGQWLLDRHVPQNKLVLETKARDTLDNYRRVKELLNELLLLEEQEQQEQQEGQNDNQQVGATNIEPPVAGWLGGGNEIGFDRRREQVVGVVTASYHLPRSMILARKILSGNGDVIQADVIIQEQEQHFPTLGDGTEKRSRDGVRQEEEKEESDISEDSEDSEISEESKKRPMHHGVVLVGLSAGSDLTGKEKVARERVEYVASFRDLLRVCGLFEVQDDISAVQVEEHWTRYCGGGGGGGGRTTTQGGG